ncbi:MAG: hypothetical protein ACJAUM_003342, partial [Pseudomonadales bacterium]
PKASLLTLATNIPQISSIPQMANHKKPLIQLSQRLVDSINLSNTR